MEDNGLIYGDDQTTGLSATKRRHGRTWRSSGNSALTPAGMNSVGKARSRSLSSVKLEDGLISEVMVRDDGFGET